MSLCGYWIRRQRQTEEGSMGVGGRKGSGQGILHKTGWATTDK